MKKIFTLMWAIVCAALTIVSCTPDNGDDNNGGVVSASKITVTGAPEANLTPAAGELSLGYAIENPTLTDALVVTTEAAWVKVGEIGEATVALTYEANTDAPGTPAREAVIKFAYNGAEDVLVTLKQDSQAPSFEIEWLNVTCGSAQYTCTPADNEMLYLLASTQDLGQYGVQGETPQELMKNYAEMLATYGMLSGEADGWFVFKGATTEMPKDASRFNAEDTVSVFALGISVTVGEMDPETGMPAITVDHLTPVHAWEVPFLPYPTVTVPEAQLTNNVSSAAGELVLDCVLENALNDGSEVTLSTEATWVHPTWADNKLTIAYDANTVAVARRAKIAVQYGYWTNPFEVTLVQEKDATATAITLNLTVKGTQFNGILVDIVPSDENVVYALNYTTPEKDWETGAEVAIDWMSKAEELLSYAGNTTFHKGTLTDHLIKTNVSNYEWYGYDYYVYAIPVALEEIEGAVKVNQILGETTVSEKVTIDVSKMPKLEWDVEKSGLTWNENNGRYDLEVVEGSTVVLHYILTNPVEGASVKLNGNSLYDSYNVVDGEPVIDNAAKTITFKIDKFDTAKKYHYVSPGFKYTNEAEDMWGITTPSLRLTQVEAPAPAGPVMITSVADLKAGEYYAGGYLTSYDYNGSTLDWTANPYHLINGISTDLYTTPYAYTDGQLVKKEGEQYDAAIVTLEAVEGAANTYYVKVGADYLTSTQAANRKLGKTSTPSEWVASDNPNGGISLKHVDTGVYLGTAGATSKLRRSYTSESTLKYGLVFFTVAE